MELLAPKELVRQTSRPIEIRQGLCVPQRALQQAFGDMLSTLAQNGLNTRTYDPAPESDGARCMAQAFFPANEEFRQEPILFDLNSRAFEGGSMLSIAVRHYNTTGSDYYDFVHAKLNAHDIDPIRALSTDNDTRRSFPEDLRIFRIYFDDRKRSKPVIPLSERIAGSLGELLDRVGDRLRPRPVPA